MPENKTMDARPPKQVSTAPELAIILAGGKGTRLRPITKETPKPMVTIRGRPILFYPLDRVIELGVGKILITVSYKSEIIKKTVEETYARSENISFVEEKEPLGTGGAIRNALEKSGQRCNNLLVINGDEICDVDLKGMYRFHLEKNAPITLAIVEVEDAAVSGVVEMDHDRVSSFVEKPDPKAVKSKLISCGIYLFSRDSLRLFPKDRAFNLSRDFLQHAASEGLVYGYRSGIQPYAIDTAEKYRRTKEALE
ncbi:MAG: nucleotidyltransferase family protein [Candidatus Micrarchaeota archaeon]|nr:nucleotidyltransferase family protein [Candidatus Micrarchaeota archaeon]